MSGGNSNFFVICWIVSSDPVAALNSSSALLPPPFEVCFDAFQQKVSSGFVSFIGEQLLVGVDGFFSGDLNATFRSVRDNPIRRIEESSTSTFCEASKLT